MPSDWKTVTIEEIKAPRPNAISMGPFGSDIKTNNFVPTGVPIIRGMNLNSGRFNEEDFVFITEEKADSLHSANAFPHDIVFTHRGTLGQVGIIPRTAKHNRYVISQSQMKLTCDKSKVDPLFIFYFFRSPLGQHALLRNTSTTGVPAIAQPLTSLKRITLSLPLLEEQKVISSMLGKIDDKIELNLKINNTLQSMIQLLFKSWFIDFEFPNEDGKPYKPNCGDLEDSELGLIPKGWTISEIGKEVKVGGGSTPNTSEPSFWQDGHIYWANPKDMSYLTGPILFSTERKITHKGLEAIGSRQYPVGTLLLSSRAPIGYLALAEIPVAINQGIIAMVCDGQLSNYYMLNWCETNMHIIMSRANGTTFQEISKSNFRNIKILVPPRHVLEAFDKLVGSLYLKIIENLKESITLTEMRDALLPKLLSGEIRVLTEITPSG